MFQIYVSSQSYEGGSHKCETHPRVSEKILKHLIVRPRENSETPKTASVLKLPMKFLRWWSLRTAWGWGRQYEYNVTQPRGVTLL